MREYSKELRAMMPFAEYLGHEIHCECGRVHHADTEEIVIGVGAADYIGELLHLHGYSKVFLLQDQNTRRVAGEKIHSQLEKEGFEVYSHVYIRPEGEWLSGDERTMDEGASAFLGCARRPDVLIAIGTGTLNDLGKAIAHMVGDVPQWIIGTAASMDGYTSTVAALVRNNLKTTEYYAPPQVVIGDVGILATAPHAMTVAGVADMAAKYNGNIDWRLNSILCGEAYCDFVADLMLKATDQVMDLALELPEDGTFSNEFYEKLMCGLALSGIAMSYQGSSLPASGSEHHMSHYWEMWLLLNEKPAIYHGEKVGVGTMVLYRLVQMFLELPIEARRVIPRHEKFNEEAHKEIIRRVYGKAAPAVLENYHYNAEKRIERLNMIVKNRRQINAMIRAMLPSLEKMKKAMEKVGATMDWSGLPNISAQQAYDCLLYAREIRTRYTMFQLMCDIGFDLRKVAPELLGGGFSLELLKADGKKNGKKKKAVQDEKTVKTEKTEKKAAAPEETAKTEKKVKTADGPVPVSDGSGERTQKNSNGAVRFFEELPAHLL